MFLMRKSEPAHWVGPLPALLQSIFGILVLIPLIDQLLSKCLDHGLRNHSLVFPEVISQTPSTPILVFLQCCLCPLMEMFDLS